MKEEGANELLTNCNQLKMTASDGKKRLTDVADTEQLLRIIQSISSPKKETTENQMMTQKFNYFLTTFAQKSPIKSNRITHFPIEQTASKTL